MVRMLTVELSISMYTRAFIHELAGVWLGAISQVECISGLIPHCLLARASDGVHLVGR